MGWKPWLYGARYVISLLLVILAVDVAVWLIRLAQ